MIPLKSHVNLWLTIACQIPEVNQRTVDTFLKRTSTIASALQFLTRDLPQLGKDLDKGLSSGILRLSSGHFKRYKNSAHPVFMRELTTIIFDNDGYIRSEIPLGFIRKLRSLLYMFYKLELPFTEEAEIEAYRKFVAVDNEVKTHFEEDDISQLRHIFNCLLPDNPMDIKPQHSSGATADRLTNVEKRVVKRYIPELYSVFGATYFYNSQSHLRDWLDRNDLCRATPNSRVALVPKDARGPRIICMEPHERMFIQQGLMSKIYDHIECDSIAKGYVNFTRQSINQRLAYLGSLDQRYATLDLKDASDLVSWELISRVVRPEWLAVLEATRSSIAELPDGSQCSLKKFAPMGSALCFPIEAILFYSIARLVTDKVWVYGDDIIVGNAYAIPVIEKLHHYGLKVNVDKSLFTGFFRESCGADYYRGDLITPVRYRKNDVESIIAYANQIRVVFGDSAGHAVIDWADSIDRRSTGLVERVFTPRQDLIPRLPLEYQDSGYLAYFSDTRCNSTLFPRRWNKSLQRYELRILSVVQKVKQTSDGYDFLHDWFTQKCKSVSPDEDTAYNRIMEGLLLPKRVEAIVSPTSRVRTSVKRYGYRWVDFSLSC